MAAPKDNISQAVGVNGSNAPRDVAWVQAYLNMAPPALGGPAPKLKQDGLFGPKTRKGIEGFQRHHFGQFDGRVDPGKRTEQKLIELEANTATRPLVHIEAAREQARIWMKAGQNFVSRAINESGGVTLDRSGQSGADLFQLAFHLNLKAAKGGGSPGSGAPTTAQLLVVRRTFERASALLGQTITVMRIKFMAAEDELRPPLLSHRSPLGIGGSIILANYKFTDFDPVCAFGSGPFTRAAMLLQAAFLAADFFRGLTITANEPFITSGLAPADLAIHSSGHYSFFSQGMAAGGALPRPFHHVPDQTTGWTDPPPLP
jgi:hypothetical protein